MVRALVVIGVGVIVVVGAIGLNFLILDDDELDGAPPERITAAPTTTPAETAPPAAAKPAPRTDETKPATAAAPETTATTESGPAPQAETPDVAGGGIRLERRGASAEELASRPDTNAGQTKPAGEAVADIAPTFDVVRVTPEGEAVADIAPTFDVVRVTPEGEAVADIAPTFDVVRVTPEGEAVADIAPTFDVVRVTPEGEAVADIAPTFDVVRVTPEGEAVADIAPTFDVVRVTPEGEAVADIAPTFDVVRVTPEGEAVIAGRARPGSRVIIQEGETVLGEVTADPRGEWVFVPEAPLDSGSRRLGLKMEIEGQAPVLSESVVVLVVPERGKDIGGEPAKGETQALALKVPRERSGASVILQRPEPTAARVFRLMVDTVDYDDRGLLTISGHAAADGIVHAYLDNAFIGRAESDAEGAWSLRPNRLVEPGLYTLRADQVDEGGKVLARISMPFSRAAPLTTMAAGTYVIVQPGNSLWRIARRTYGTGFAYTVIFEANLGQIKEADMIFPGQIFSLPVTN